MNEGKLLIIHKKILQIQADFFRKLYQKDTNIQCVLNDKAPQRISDGQACEIDTPLTLEKLQDAIRTTARKKSPGTSGFQIDLYIVFWHKIKDYLLAAYNYALATDVMLIQQRQGVITLIPKKSRDLKYVRNWRPIVLLNSDYKLLSKVIANRIKKVW